MYVCMQVGIDVRWNTCMLVLTDSTMYALYCTVCLFMYCMSIYVLYVCMYDRVPEEDIMILVSCPLLTTSPNAHSVFRKTQPLSNTEFGLIGSRPVRLYYVMYVCMCFDYLNKKYQYYFKNIAQVNTYSTNIQGDEGKK